MPRPPGRDRKEGSRTPGLAGACIQQAGGSAGAALDGAGLSAREIADYLGHERLSMTQEPEGDRRCGG
ncbi:hypothetical protein GCM10023222_35110 [Saccharopolyspora cebuensis]